jgi:hypothetical protein
MDILSRVEKTKEIKMKRANSFAGLAWFFLYGLVLLMLFLFFRKPQTSEIFELSLFFCSVLFFVSYLLAFTFAASAKYSELEARVGRANLFIIWLWALSIFYHFGLWLKTSVALSDYYYLAGLAVTIGAFVLTFAHFCSYFSLIKKDNKVRIQNTLLKNRREAYEHLKSIFSMYDLIRGIMNQDPEVRQMIKWNQFDRKMERLIGEVEIYLNVTFFTPEDLEEILSVKAWLNNLLVIIGQHPLHRGFSGKIGI